VAAASRPVGRGEIISAVGTLGDTPFRIHSTYVWIELYDKVNYKLPINEGMKIREKKSG
jgi:hypothetical protein